MRRFGRGAFQVVTMVIAFIIAIISSAIIARFIVGAGVANVRGESMEPNLQDGEMYLYTQRSDIERYDIVLANFLSSAGDKVLVKRVIGVPGDELGVINGELYINGEFYEEPYISNNIDNFELESFKVELEEDEFFLMGDNRDFSLDSREDLGIVNINSIEGVLKRDITDMMKGVGYNE